MNTKTKNVAIAALASSLMLFSSSALSNAAPSSDRDTYYQNGSKVTLNFAPGSEISGGARDASGRVQDRRVESITVVTPGDSSATTERTVSTFEQPIDAKTARKLAGEGTEPAKPTKDEISRGLEAARRAAQASATTPPQSSPELRSSSRSDATTFLDTSASEAILLACSKKEGFRSTPSGTMYLSIYCGRTNPRIGFAFMLNQKLVERSLGDAEDTGMRWTYNGHGKPILPGKTWKSKGGYLTGVFAPIAVDSEVTYGDSLYYRLWTGPGSIVRVFHTDIGGTIYPV